MLFSVEIDTSIEIEAFQCSTRKNCPKEECGFGCFKAPFLLNFKMWDLASEVFRKHQIPHMIDHMWTYEPIFVLVEVGNQDQLTNALKDLDPYLEVLKVYPQTYDKYEGRMVWENGGEVPYTERMRLNLQGA